MAGRVVFGDLHPLCPTSNQPTDSQPPLTATAAFQTVARGKPPLTLEELEGHCEGTSSQLLYLQLAAAGGFWLWSALCGWLCVSQPPTQIIIPKKRLFILYPTAP